MVDLFPIQRKIIFQIKIWECLANCEKVRAQVKQTVSWLFATFWIPAKPAVDNLDVHLDVHLEIALEVHDQVPTRQSPDCLRPFWIPAKPAVDNLDVHLDVHLETVPKVHEQVLTQQSPDCLVTPDKPAIKKEPAEPAAKYT